MLNGGCSGLTSFTPRMFFSCRTALDAAWPVTWLMLSSTWSTVNPAFWSSLATSCTGRLPDVTTIRFSGSSAERFRVERLALRVGVDLLAARRSGFFARLNVFVLVCFVFLDFFIATPREGQTPRTLVSRTSVCPRGTDGLRRSLH